MQDQVKVFFFGDSICFGQGISLFMGWVSRLSEKLWQYGNSIGTEIHLTNTSINGNTTRLALERMPYDVQSNQPDILIVQFGMNDCNYWETDGGNPRVSLKAFEANLCEIIQRARSFGVQKIILNTNHPSARDKMTMAGTNITYQESNSLYNEAIRRVAHQNTDGLVSIVDIEKRFFEHFQKSGGNPADFVQKDLLHLNEDGHDLYFDIYYPHLLSAVNSILEVTA
jgi:lysophospholipase L1-like esterase